MYDDAEPGFDRDAWLAWAEPERLDATVVGFVWANPGRVGPRPHRWRLVSRALADGALAASPRLWDVLPEGAALAFLDFHPRTADLPDPAACLARSGDGRPARLRGILAQPLAAVLCVRIVREVVARWAGPADVAALYAFLDETFQSDMTILATRLLTLGHGLDMRAHMPRALFERHPVIGVVLGDGGR